MGEMPELVMPDQSASTYRDEFGFSPTIEGPYHSLPRTLRGFFMVSDGVDEESAGEISSVGLGQRSPRE